MEFANATYLWGLLGLLVPVAIHLWSRKKVVTLKIGSTKFLESSEPKQTSSIKLNEWWLLFLRMLFILLLVLIMSEPRITRSKENIAICYMVEASLLNDDRMSSILDTLPKESVFLLEKGFPEWEADTTTTTTTTTESSPNYWQLAQEMKSISADSIVVFSRGLLKGIHGSRPIIHANTKWIVLESANAIEKELVATRKNEYVELLSLSSDAHTLSFKKDSLSLNSEKLEINLKQDSITLKATEGKSKIALGQNTPIRIAVVYDDSIKLQYQYLKAAYVAISKFLDTPLEMVVLKELNTLNTISFNTVVSFSDVIPKETHAPLLIFNSDLLAKNLIVNGPTEDIFYLTKLLDSENIVEEHLPEQLLVLLQGYKELESNIAAKDQRILAETELQPIRSKFIKEKNTASILKMNPWLWLILILVVIAERILSKFRKQ